MDILTELSKHNIIVFIEKYGIQNELGKKLDFKDHRFMVEPYMDMSAKQVCLKAAQIGFSTMAILKSLWLCGAKGMEVCYILPTSGAVKDFVSSKVNRMIAGNPILSSWTKDKDTIEQKHVNGHVISYRGSFVENAALMISVDLMIADEVSRSDQKVVEQYASRLQHSDFKYEWYFSNPSVPGEVLDLKWKESDMKKWHIQCDCRSGDAVTKLTDDGTKGWRVLDESCINYMEEIFECPDCKTEITDEMRRMGEWFPTQSVTTDGRKPVFSGYWIPVWLYPKIHVPYIREQKKKSAEYFANFVAGLPHEVPGSRVDLSTIKKIVTDRANPQDGRVIIGADTGAGMVKYVIGNAKGIFYYAKDRNYDQLKDIMRNKFPDAILMIDQGGDLIGNRELQEEFPGRVFLCYFNRPQAALRLVKWGTNEEQGKVVIDRERMIQLVVDEMNSDRIPLNGSFDEWYDYGVEWERLYRFTEMVDNEPVRTWTKSSTPCDYPFCTVYWRAGISRFVGDLEGALISPKRSGSEQELVGAGGRVISQDELKSWLGGENDDWRSNGTSLS